MRRTNRVEPVKTGAHDLARAIMITTTQLEIIRRVEVTPIGRESTDPIRSRIDQPCVTTPIKRSRKILWCIGCLFITAGLLALSIMITGLTIIFGKMNAMRKSNIERYDLGDLHYGINNIKHPSNTYLSNINKVFIQKYLSDQLLTEPGYRGLVIDEIFIQDKLDTNRRKQRDTSCSIIFIIQNIQVYFEHCSTCINKRNLILRDLFFNITAVQQPFYLLLNTRHIFIQICSTPNISHLILPKRLNISYVQKLNLKYTFSTLSPLKTNLQIDTSKSNDISRVVSIIFTSKSTIDVIETTSVANVDESISFTTDYLSPITELDSSQTHETSSISLLDTQSSAYIPTSFQKTTENIFQFLPFRPSKTISPRRSITRNDNNSLTMTKITATQRQTRVKHEKKRTF